MLIRSSALDAAKDHSARGSLQHAGDDDVHVLVDGIAALLHNHHGAVVEVAHTLSNLISLFDDLDGQVLAGQGHNVIGVGCAPKLAARFIDTADASKLETECLDALSAPPPFAGFYGWEP